MSKKPDRVFIVVQYIDCEMVRIVEVFCSEHDANTEAERLTRAAASPLVVYTVSEHPI